MSGTLAANGIEDEDPKRELSLIRIALAILILVSVGLAAVVGVERSTSASGTPETGSTWFAPYVDATLTPVADFQDPGSNPARQTVLGFVVADPEAPCTPSWGGAYSLDEAASELGMDRRIAQYRAQGGQAVVSFGGAANDELAHVCTDVDQLTAAYSDVVDRYEQTVVDFDIEAATLEDAAANERRAAALVAVQDAADAEGRPFDVWLTLPVATSGLDAKAMAVVTTTLEAGVDLAGVNVMSMNFGTAERDMGEAVHDSLTATHEQLSRVFTKYDVTDGSSTWEHMGTTVMIGQNDTDGERYTTDDAVRLNAEAEGWGLGRVSTWSLNRDQQCGGSFAVVGVNSNTCSGTEQSPLGFSQIFAKLTGSIPDAADTAGTATPVATPTRSVVADDPTTSPFPLWQPNRPYETGYKVVRHGDVYQAKWYTRGQDPAAQGEDSSQSPWQIIGPVLPGEVPAPLPTVKKGTYPEWSAETSYEAGDRVLYEQLPFEAKWYNAETSPGAYDADPSASPWKPLFTVPGQPTSQAG